VTRGPQARVKKKVVRELRNVVTCGIGVNAMDLLVEGPAVVLGLKNG
jgi:hypothetical protein